MLAGNQDEPERRRREIQLDLLQGASGELSGEIARLRSADAILERLLAANILAVAIFDDRGFLVQANPLFRFFIGLTPRTGAAAPLNWSQLVPSAELPKLERAREQLRQTATTLPWETLLSRPDGSTLPVLTGATL